MEVVRRSGHEPSLPEPFERVGDRRPLGRHELAEQAVGERKREPYPARLHPAPARGEVPEQQDEADPWCGQAVALEHALDSAWVG